MSKRVLFIIFVLLISTLFSANSKKKQEVNREKIKPQLEFISDYSWGYHSYDIHDEVYYETGEIEGFRSLLEYPMDYPMFGGKFSLFGTSKRGNRYSLSFMYLKNYRNPYNPMYDSDWWTDTGGTNPVVDNMFSYTESEARVDASYMDLELSLGVYKIEKYNIAASLLLGYNRYDFDYEMYGVQGWQTDEWGYYDPYYFDLMKDTLVLTYEAEYTALYSGVGFICNTKKPEFEISAKIKASPIAIAKDYDDHVLRFTTSDSNINGGTFYDISGEICYVFPGTILNGRKVRAKAGYNIVHYNLSGSQSQKFYDEEDEEYTEVLFSFAGIPNDLVLDKQNIWFGISCEL